MRHRKAGRRLSRNAPHRLAMFRNMTMALIRHERIVTTVEKAKELRPFVERLITLAKRSLTDPSKALQARRLALARLGPVAKAEVTPSKDEKDRDSRHIIVKLFKELAPRYANRNGGYTRVLKRLERRLGDAGRTAFIELIPQGEVKPEKTKAGPAPRVTPNVEGTRVTGPTEATGPTETPTPAPTASAAAPPTDPTTPPA